MGNHSFRRSITLTTSGIVVAIVDWGKMKRKNNSTTVAIIIIGYECIRRIMIANSVVVIIGIGIGKIILQMFAGNFGAVSL